MEPPFTTCMSGLEARDQQGSAPAYKPTSVLTNHPALAGVLQEKCAGGHRHVQLVGKQACSRAAAYPRVWCDAVAKGINIAKHRCEEVMDTQKKVVELGWCAIPTLCEDSIYEVELEDMCEQGPSTW